MGLLSQFEERAESIIEGKNSSKLKFGTLAKVASKEMKHECMVGASGKYAPTLYNVLISYEDDAELSDYLEKLAAELETYLSGYASSHKLALDCPPLVRFMVDESLRRGRFDVQGENVSPRVIAQLREEEREHYAALHPAPIPVAQPAPQEPATFDNDVFDPFVPSDMQKAVYVPLDAPNQGHGVQTIDYGDNDPFADEPQQAPAAMETVVMHKHLQAPKAELIDLGSGQAYNLKAPETIIGRETDCDISICDLGISRHHGKITFESGAWIFTDTNSMNGTLVNGIITTQIQLQQGDKIEIGDTRLEFREA